MMTTNVRWDWVIVAAAFMVAAIVAQFGMGGRGVAIAVAYLAGRWDSEFGGKYRQMVAK